MSLCSFACTNNSQPPTIMNSTSSTNGNNPPTTTSGVNQVPVTTVPLPVQVATNGTTTTTTTTQMLQPLGIISTSALVNNRQPTTTAITLNR